MTNNKNLKFIQEISEEEQLRLIKKRDCHRNWRKRAVEFKKEQEDLKKEITETKIYIKNIWGKPTPLKDISYKEIRKLGEELGMNVFNVKNFDKSNTIFKDCICTCKYCNKKYDIKVKKGTRSKNLGVCKECRAKKYEESWEYRKIKNKIKWERLIIDVLTKNGGLSIKKITKKLECSGCPIRKAIKRLVEEGKIKMDVEFYDRKINIFSIVS